MIDTTGLFDIWSVVSFLVGILAVWVWERIKLVCIRKRFGKRMRPPRWNPLVVAVAVAVMGFLFIADQNSENARAVRDLAIQTQRCQKEFNETLRVRGAITADNDRLSLVQRREFATWLHDIIFPPDNIAALPIDDPVRQEWGLTRTAQADAVIRRAQEEQDKNDQERARNPYPEPTCGVEVPR